MPNPDKRPNPGVERRKKPRHEISPNFRLKALLSLNSGAEPGSSGTWKDWTATLVDLSATGVHVQLSMGAVAFPGDRCRLKLSLGTFKLEVPGVVAHYICDTRSGVCGVQFDFANEGVEKAFYRVLESVVVGSSIAPVGAKPDETGRYHEQFAGKNFAKLSAWRPAEGGPVTDVEFRMGRYVITAHRPADAGPYVRPTMKIVAAEDGEAGAAYVPLTPTHLAEARWQFSLIASNLTPVVPVDIQKFLLPLATG